MGMIIVRNVEKNFSMCVRIAGNNLKMDCWKQLDKIAIGREFE